MVAITPLRALRTNFELTDLEFAPTWRALVNAFNTRSPYAASRARKYLGDYAAILKHRDSAPEHLRIRLARLTARSNAITALMRRHASTKAFAQEYGATPERAIRPAFVYPPDRLLEQRRINNTQARAAYEIAAIYQALFTGVTARSRGWSDAPSRRHGFDFSDHTAEKWAEWHARRYLPWIRDMGNAGYTLGIKLVLEVVVYGYAVARVAERFHMTQRKCEAWLRDGLSRYARIAAGDRREE